MGQLGDLFGGINALFTAWAFAGVIWTGLLQRRDISMQARDLEESREVMRDQQRVMQQQQTVAARQQFEATFFNLLGQLREMTDQLRGTEPLRGAAAVDEMAAEIDGRLINSRQLRDPRVCIVLAVDEYLRIYGESETTLGPYFRTMYHVFKFVDEAPFEMSETDEVRYANIARAQLSEGAVLLLALNGITDAGKGFKSRIEKYGLLKHLSTAHRDRYLSALHLVYERRAFVHADARALMTSAEGVLTIVAIRQSLGQPKQSSSDPA